ncbi:uncharacterized protein LOC129779861 [Toxorhynchites rutilus septentrionalis]|uniref:uncharacterized protein LOC129779861 n=1 Tax=Toxorhynchites rutilus septentrionalis TaxID=329112 RepID=UPI002479AED2|nr:uncharacterized protein LOC129779861 [Toxorhynchites rutilus septentrionalis]XP_055643579.1 uncharacterized protein LOC129779861 [Toxorhynchites rutilus septentrionalis]
MIFPSQLGALVLLLIAVPQIRSELLRRTDRSALRFPVGTSNGFLIAIAIPLEVPGRNIYLSHNFEMNYGLPGNASDFRLWYTLFKNANYNISEAIGRKRRMVDGRKLGRKFLYELLAERMDMYGYNGSSCIQKMICEAQETSLQTHNGVIGDLMHILFSPSSSENEGISDFYYEAETHGFMESCAQYDVLCPIAIFDSITTIIID